MSDLIVFNKKDRSALTRDRAKVDAIMKKGNGLDKAFPKRFSQKDVAILIDMLVNCLQIEHFNNENGGVLLPSQMEFLVNMGTYFTGLNFHGDMKW